jgi:hypothetical protein
MRATKLPVAIEHLNYDKPELNGLSRKHTVDFKDLVVENTIKY